MSLRLFPVKEEKEAQALLDLLEEAFPEDERRSRSGQAALLQQAQYRLLACADSAQPELLLGLCAVWDLADWLFIEHFAIASAYRNRGIGAQVLALLAKEEKRRLCLEVELPETALARRRIAFYQRNGFVLSEYHYQQPALGADRAAIPLRLMVTGDALSHAEFAALRRLLYREVYHVAE